VWRLGGLILFLELLVIRGLCLFKGVEKILWAEGEGLGAAFQGGCPGVGDRRGQEQQEGDKVW